MVRLRLAALVGLLALVPMALYLLGRSATALALIAVSVLLIVGSLWLMFGEAEAPTAHPEP